MAGADAAHPHFAVGTKDPDGSRLFYEPLAGWDPDGNLMPILAAEVPSVEAGTVDKDLKWVVWKLKQGGVTWHDGQPFTADDCVFNWQYASDPTTAATTMSSYKDINVVKVDDHTIKVEFKKSDALLGRCLCQRARDGHPQASLRAIQGANSREAPANLSPVGTGPYLFVDFKPADLARGKINPNYHQCNRPYFDAVEMKGGGDAISAARAVLQTGEYDFAWNMQVEDELLKRLEEGRKATSIFSPAAISSTSSSTTPTRKERRQAQSRLSDLDQRTAPEKPADCQAGLREGRN